MASGVRLVPNVERLQDMPIRMPSRTSFLASALLLTLLLPACSRRSGVPQSQGSAPGGARPLPFHRNSETNGVSPTQAFGIAIPMGTPLVVRLDSALSSESAQTGEDFSGSLDDAVVLGGRLLLPRGAKVTGKVISAKSAQSRSDPGYLRLTLSSVVTNGQSFDLHTSSVFAKGSRRRARPDEPESLLQAATARDGSDHLEGSDARFSTARRLSFVLVQSLSANP